MKNLLLKQPLIVGVVTSSDGLSRLSNKKYNKKIDIAEIRLDMIGVHKEWLNKIRKIKSNKIPVLLTIRDKSEGGFWQDSGKCKRLDLFEDALNEGAVTAIDIEIGSPIFPQLANLAKIKKVILIASFHDFRKVPDLKTLRKITDSGFKSGASIVKIAAFVNKKNDIDRLHNLLTSEKRPLCVIGMGDKGADTRIRFAKAGSRLAFAFIDRPSAPGQFSVESLKKMLEE